MISLPHDDPRRRLYAAARWMTGLGWAYVAFGLQLVVMGLWASRVMTPGASLLAAGAMFVVAAPFARRHRRWAVRLGQVASAFAGVVLVVLLVLLGESVGWRDLSQGRSPAAAAAALLLILLMAIQGLIAWNLSHAGEALATPYAPANAGFEPITAAPRAVLPVEPEDGQ